MKKCDDRINFKDQHTDGGLKTPLTGTVTYHLTVKVNQHHKPFCQNFAIKGKNE